MNITDYKSFYDNVGKTNGWDFSRVKCTIEGNDRDFYKEVKQSCGKGDMLLDIGTGGGEAILTIAADSALLLIGIDQSAWMIETAARNAAKSGLPNVRFLQMEAERLIFPANLFNVVSCRHSEFYAEEVARVLTNSGGLFFTQQVSENDKFNLKLAFGRGQSFGIEAGTLKQRYLSELREAGFSDIQSWDISGIEYYHAAEDLSFLLKHTPIIPDFGREEADFKLLQQFIEQNQTEKGIRTNSERFVIQARL
ncbi:ubiquinone/menaquinone biosynthesis C-methylase UbiE [Paenibacillus taihuensis]|uniref:Ubiquinone/menaquinone biosynthesis C-methylase UbiE n=1 Tax=Paenibacillus taihuensis TaxID=1156355 RepID=A0A3D9SFV5_9BACL|nr:class I SAM-dependent methyltransferase [Paenibacillus taihuensis]REE94537.1 ubiquinone/menaquinone biosynthesis C-methylase UbiE [Paenibacillus taihuensis]